MSAIGPVAVRRKAGERQSDSCAMIPAVVSSGIGGEIRVRIAPYIIIGIVEVLLALWFFQDRAPLRVVGYVGFCPRHLSACEDEISKIDTTLRLIYVADEQYCPPARLDLAREEREIRAWLSAHPSMRRRPATIGIRAALLARHHCQMLTGTSELRLRAGVAN